MAATGEPRRASEGVLLLWAPPLALMTVIFALSAQPDLSSGLGTLDLIGRKLIHAGEYALLTLLWWRVTRRHTEPARAIAVAAAIALLYAASDEFHQCFVEGRHGTPVDVAIDSVGIALASLYARRRS
ncbi:MAG TPA: VanZ family protein [Thermoleophilaceae bacterium]|nr:VanZ family protein [Thermoleophilaceae bacterium]